ncbi:MAG: Gfo/Idh/MocA family oxidoreductase [Rhodospirillales bacterium]|nr:Gfo/Idh/MocA family oxidoreductase [Rhodospirillales bacterium]
MLRMAIVGTGWWGMELGKAAHSIPDVAQVTGCFSLSEAECKRFREMAGGEIYASFDAVLSDASVDAVFLATPHSLHWQQIIAAATAGKHVFVEKPMTLTVETASAAIKPCEKNSVVLGVGHNRRYSPVARKMKAMIDAGDCGQIIHAEGNYSGNAAYNYPPDYWRAQRSELPGGSLTPMALHIVDTMTWLLGPVARLTAIVKRQALPIDLDDTTAVLFELNSGVTASLGTLFAVPQSNYLRIYGTRANLEARNNYAELTVTTADGNQPETRLTFTGDDTLQSEIRAFADACAGKSDFPIRPVEALRNVAVVEAIKASAEANGAWMDVAQDVIN